MSVYLLHFSEPYRWCRHYLGYTSDLKRRLARHEAGTGARLVEVIKEAGIGWKLARVWEDGDRVLERRLKRRKNSPRLCPLCRKALGIGKRRMACAAV